METFPDKKLRWVLLALLACLLLTAARPAQAALTPSDLINAINTARVAYGLPALSVDPILMSTAQSTADIMAVNSMSWHIGDVRGRVMAAGYGGGATAWATENFAVGSFTVDELMSGPWADADHMIPVVSPNYTDIGAGVSEFNGRIYYVVQAAYTASGAANRPPPRSGPAPAGTAAATTTPAVSQLIIPVETATPGVDGKIVHEVKSGQSLWAIAIAYHTHIVDVQNLNGMAASNLTLQIGQKLSIPPEANLTAPTPQNAELTAIAQMQAAAQGTPAATAEATQTPGEQRRPTRTPLPRFTPTGGVELAGGIVQQATPLPPAQQAASRESWILPALAGAFGLGLVLILSGMFIKRQPGAHSLSAPHEPPGVDGEH